MSRRKKREPDLSVSPRGSTYEFKSISTDGYEFMTKNSSSFEYGHISSDRTKEMIGKCSYQNGVNLKKLAESTGLVIA